VRVTGLKSVLPLLLVVGLLVLVGPRLLEPPEEDGGGSVEPAPPAPAPFAEEETPAPSPPAPARLTGTVTGRPVPPGPGAWLSLTGARRRLRVPLGEGGRFEFPDVPPGRVMDLWLGPDPKGARLCLVAEKHSLEAGERRHLDLEVESRAAVRGTVTNGDGEPIEGAVVAVLRPGEDWRRPDIGVAARTGADGRFFVGISGEVPTSPLLLVAEKVADGYVLEELTVTPSELCLGTEIRVELEQGLSISGRVEGPRGEPIPDARVHLLEDLGEPAPSRRPLEGLVGTDEDGRFTDDAFRPGVYWVLATGTLGGKRIAAVRKGVRAGSGDVRVRVAGPISAEDVRLELVWNHGDDSEDWVEWAEFDADPEAEVADVPEGHYRLRLHRPGYRAYLGDLFFVRAGERHGPVRHALTPR